MYIEYNTVYVPFTSFINSSTWAEVHDDTCSAIEVFFVDVSTAIEITALFFKKHRTKRERIQSCCPAFAL